MYSTVRGAYMKCVYWICYHSLYNIVLTIHSLKKFPSYFLLQQQTLPLMNISLYSKELVCSLFISSSL